MTVTPQEDGVVAQLEPPGEDPGHKTARRTKPCELLLQRQIGEDHRMFVLALLTGLPVRCAVRDRLIRHVEKPLAFEFS